MPESRPVGPDYVPTKQLSQGEIFGGLLNKVVGTIERVEAKQDAGFTSVKADFTLLSGEFHSLKQDVRGLQSWRIRLDDWRNESQARVARLSDHAKRPSDMDLSLQAAQASEIIRNQEQDQKIQETHALAEQSAAAIAAIAQAADQRGKVLDGIASSVGLALRSKMAEKVAYAFGGFILAMLAYYAKKFGAP